MKKKRKRGRPSNAEKAAMEATDASDAEQTTQTSSLSEFGTPTSGETIQGCAANGGAGPVPSIILDLPETKEAFKPVLKHGSEWAASKTGWNGWIIEDAENEMLSKNLEIVARTLLPMLGNSPYTPAFVAGGTVIGFVGFKYLGYRAWLKEESKKRPDNAGTP